MSQSINIILPLAAGAALGTMYFGGLWLTLRRIPRSPYPGLLIFGSYMGRLAAYLLGLVLVAIIAGWRGLLICLAGVMAARFLLVRRWGVRRLGAVRPGDKSGNQS